MIKYKLYRLDKYNCMLTKIKFSKDYYMDVNELEKEIEFRRINDKRFSNLFEREQLVICEKNQIGWRIYKILGEGILMNLK